MEGPILRGIVRFLEDGRAIWEGSWGYTSSAFQEKIGLNNFRYVCQKHAKFVVGDVLNFRGHFEVASTKNKTKGKSQFTEKKFEIEMLEDEAENLRKVRGTGSNRFGNFVLVGKFDSSSQVLEVQRTYSKPDPNEVVPKIKKKKVKTETVSAIPNPGISFQVSYQEVEPVDVDPNYCPDAQAVLIQLKLKDTKKWFSFPVDAQALGLNDYHGIVTDPMDLGTIQAKLNSKAYLSQEECFEDMKLTFVNALMYNPRGNPVYKAASELSTFLNERIKALGTVDSSISLSIGKRNRIKKRFYEPGEDDEIPPSTEKNPSNTGKGKRGRQKKHRSDFEAVHQSEIDEGVESFDEIDFSNSSEDFAMTPPPYQEDEDEIMPIAATPEPVEEDNERSAMLLSVSPMNMEEI